MVLTMDSTGRVLELIKAIESEQFTDSPETDPELPPRTATSSIQAAAAVVQEAQDLLRPLVDEARSNGASWTQIASALGLANASSAHYLYGTKAGLAHDESREEKLAAQRARIAAYRSAQPRAEPMPGLSAVEAGRRLKIDRRTVKQKALRGEIETTTVMSAKGTPITRYLLPDEAAAASTG